MNKSNTQFSQASRRLREIYLMCVSVGAGRLNRKWDNVFFLPYYSNICQCSFHLAGSEVWPSVVMVSGCSRMERNKLILVILRIV